MSTNNILWVPLDLPPVPKDLTLEKLENLYSFKPQVDNDTKAQLAQEKKHHLYVWDSFRIHVPSDKHDQPYETQVDDIEWSWTKEAREHCPNLIKYIKENLPFKKFKYITAISSKGSVPMHYDLTESISDQEKDYYKTNDPCFYRLVLDGTMHQQSFYVYTKTMGKVYCRMPTDSPGWIMGSYSCGHGNDEEAANQKLLLYIMGDLDLNKHQGLVARSYDRYKDYAIVRDYGV